MLKLPEFQYHRPESLEEAVGLLRQYGSEARVVAGGTDLLPSMKQRLFSPAHLISLRGISGLDGLTWREDGLEIGAMVPLRVLVRDEAVGRVYPGLVEAASQVATVILQGMGTLGGNVLLDTRCYYYNQSEFWREALGHCMKADGSICQVARSSPRCLAAFSADTVPVLMLYGAEAVFVGPQGARVVPLNALYQEDGMRWLKKAPDEVLASIRLPMPKSGWKVRYAKIRQRQTIDYPLAAVGVGLKQGQDGVVEEARILLNAVASMPVEVPEAAALRGAPLSGEAIQAVALAAYQQVKPLTTHGLQPMYRKKMVQVALSRLLGVMMESSGAALELPILA